MRIHASYNVQIARGKDDLPACVLLILDGLVQEWPSPSSTCTAQLRESTLEISVSTETIALAAISKEITELLLNGSPLVVKHTASGLEAIATVN